MTTTPEDTSGTAARGRHFHTPAAETDLALEADQSENIRRIKLWYNLQHDLTLFQEMTQQPDTPPA